MKDAKQLRDRIHAVYEADDSPLVKRSVVYLLLLLFEQDVRKRKR